MIRPLSLACAALAITLAGAAAQASPTRSQTFTVIRDGEKVGTHRVAFRDTPQGTEVDIDTNVVVKMLMVPVYRFEHHGTETWRDGKLVGLTSETNDDGTHHHLAVQEVAGELRVEGDGKSRITSDELPASLWNPKTVGRNSLLNTLDGHEMPVTITALDDGTVPVKGRQIHARHYSLTGELNRELWYDDSGTLVRVRFKGKDGSDIVYSLE